MPIHNDALNLYFLIAPALYLVNTIIATSFAFKYKKDSIYKKSAAIWVFYLILGVSQGALQKSDPFVIGMAWSVAAFFVISCMSIFISDILKAKNNYKMDIVYFVVALGLATVLKNMSLELVWILLPATFFSAYPMLKHISQFKKFKKNNFTKNGILIFYVLVSLHVIDYAYALDKPHLMFPGYLLALMLAIGASCFTFAALVERVIIENEVKELLQNTARLTALGGMAAEISHEIKNPLTVLSMNNAQMKNKLGQNQLIFDVEYFQNKTDVAEKMLKRLLDIMNTLQSHYNSGIFDNFKQISVKEIFDEAQLICDFRAKREGVTVTFAYPVEPLLFECRSVQIIQTVQNIIQNAIDELEGVVAPQIVVSASSFDEQHVKITISDNGPGIDPDIRPFIFDSLFTTKPKEKGSGLGLSISKRFIEEHGGRLYLENSVDTKFVIVLPVTQVYVENQIKKKVTAS